MELVSFGFLMGVVFCFVIFGAGVVYDERVNQRKHIRNIHRDILCDRNTDDDSCGVGSVHGEKHCRQDRGFEDMGDDLK